jgi:hypothetical protein
MLSILRLPEARSEDEMHDPDAQPRIQSLVFALHDKTYRQLKALCGAFKLKLRGIVPEESFAYAHDTQGCSPLCDYPLGLDEEDESVETRVMVDVHAFQALGALLVDGRPAAFARHDFGAGEDPVVGVANLVEDLRGLQPGGEPVPPKEIVLGGQRVEEDINLDLLNEGPEDAAVRVWDAAEDMASMECRGPLPARYMTAVGAAVQMTSKLRELVVDDHVPLKKKVFGHPMAIPAMVLLLFCAGITLDYQFQKYRTESLRSAITQLEEQKTELAEAAETGSGAKQKYSGLRGEVNRAKAQMDLLNRGLKHRGKLIKALMAGLIQETFPGTMRLTRIAQFSEEVWFVEGEAHRYTDITSFVVELKQLPMIRQCRLESSSEDVRNKDEDGRPYAFSLRLRLGDV